MRPTHIILIALNTALSLATHAQTSTNLPPTQIENFELQPDTIMVKGFGEMGSVATEGGTVSVHVKESNNATINQKMYGASVSLAAGRSHGSLVVDYDEIEALTNALDYLGKISYNVTRMPGFDASFTTRSGLRVGARLDHRQSAIQLYLQFDDTGRIPLAASQFTQFQILMDEAKESLDVTRPKNSAP
jgi:hypothetical protein